MARNTTRQGAGFELDVMHYLGGCDCETTHQRPRHVGWTGFGYECLRSSGSRGKVDVVAVGSVDTMDPWSRPNLLFVQCKITNPVIPPAERVALRELALRAGAAPVVAHRAKDLDTGLVRPHFRILTGPGPKEWEPWAPGEDSA